MDNLNQFYYFQIPTYIIFQFPTNRYCLQAISNI